MNEKKSAHYQRRYRQRLRDLGLVKKEMWILPERAAELHVLEKELRRPISRLKDGAPLPEGEAKIMAGQKLWTTRELFDALAKAELFVNGRASVEIINPAEPCLHIVMRDYGDLPLFLTVSRQHILAEAFLWPREAVTRPDDFNREVLRTHKFFSLSAVGLNVLPDGSENYIMFGSLSAASILPSIIFEIETLADNVIRATEAYEAFLGGN